MKAKVISEKYQIHYSIETGSERKDIVEDVEYKDAYWRAFQVAGTHRCRVDIQRITTVKTPEGAAEGWVYSFLDAPGETTEVVTGSVTIDKEHFARDTKLSRYHPNNGWVIPEYVNNFEDAILA